MGEFFILLFAGAEFPAAILFLEVKTCLASFDHTILKSFAVGMSTGQGEEGEHSSAPGDGEYSSVPHLPNFFPSPVPRCLWRGKKSLPVGPHSGESP